MRTTYTFIILSLFTASYAQESKDPRPLQRATKEIVRCLRVPGLKKPILKQMGSSVLCRLEVRNLSCLPGLTIKVDVTGKKDLCITADGRAVTEPTCTTQHRKRYLQDIIQRGQFVVERPDRKDALEWLDLPFTTSSRMEVLGQRRPIVLTGPDACVFLRHTKLVLGKQMPNNTRSSAKK